MVGRLRTEPSAELLRIFVEIYLSFIIIYLFILFLLRFIKTFITKKGKGGFAQWWEIEDRTISGTTQDFCSTLHSSIAIKRFHRWIFLQRNSSFIENITLNMYPWTPLKTNAKKYIYDHIKMLKFALYFLRLYV